MSDFTLGLLVGAGVMCLIDQVLTASVLWWAIKRGRRFFPALGGITQIFNNTNNYPNPMPEPEFRLEYEND